MPPENSSALGTENGLSKDSEAWEGRFLDLWDGGFPVWLQATGSQNMGDSVLKWRDCLKAKVNGF